MTNQLSIQCGVATAAPLKSGNDDAALDVGTGEMFLENRKFHYMDRGDFEVRSVGRICVGLGDRVAVLSDNDARVLIGYLQLLLTNK